MKKLQKGFSLVELLVVVAIIGVLAGVGIVGYQSYTESAKQKVAEANYNSVVRFIETELTLLNNGVQTASGALFVQSGVIGEACVSATAMPQAGTTAAKMAHAIECHFKTLKFKNPFVAAQDQVIYAARTTARKKGDILVYGAPANENSSNFTQKINVIYFGADGTVTFTAPVSPATVGTFSGIAGMKVKNDLGMNN